MNLLPSASRYGIAVLLKLGWQQIVFGLLAALDSTAVC